MRMAEILSSVRWGWVILAAVIAQALLIPIDYALSALAAWLGLMRGDMLLARLAIFLIFFLAGLWVARHAKAHFTANGFFVGLFAALIFLPVLIAIQPPYPGMEAVNEGLKVLAAALGGGLMGHRKRRGIRKKARH
jgi:hypothetical protein